MKVGILRIFPGEAKNKKSGRTLPLEPELHALLSAAVERKRRIERERGMIVPWVFCTDEGQRIGCALRSQWERACKAAGISGKVIHDLRRTAVRRLNSAGIARSTAMALVGHRTSNV